MKKECMNCDFVTDLDEITVCPVCKGTSWIILSYDDTITMETFEVGKDGVCVFGSTRFFDRKGVERLRGIPLDLRSQAMIDSLLTGKIIIEINNMDKLWEECKALFKERERA